MSMAFHNKLGKDGEMEARAYLESKGYEIRDQNWKHRNLEIDLIAFKDETMVFVEVKTRSKALGHVDEIIGLSKEKFLIDGANAYMEKLEKEYECRIDLILLEKKTGHSNVIHIEDAISQAQ